ncbi:MAG: hypothetical protein ACRDSL_20095 [Pseudonocardiaceae bacterium]
MSGQSTGLRYVLRHPLLRPITACTGTSNLFGGVVASTTVLFLSRELGLPAGVIGVLLAAGGAVARSVRSPHPGGSGASGRPGRSGWCCWWPRHSASCRHWPSRDGGSSFSCSATCTLAVGWVLASPLRRMRDLPMDASRTSASRSVAASGW